MTDIAFLLERLRKIRKDLRYQHCDIDFHIALETWLKEAAKVLEAQEYLWKLADEHRRELEQRINEAKQGSP